MPWEVSVQAHFKICSYFKALSHSSKQKQSCVQEDTQLKGRKRHREEKGDEDKGKDLEDNDSLEESPSKLTRLNDSSKGIKSTNDTQKQNVLSPSSEAPPQQKSMTKTVFARGLGTDVQKAELQSLLEQFGHVRACRYDTYFSTYNWNLDSYL